MNRSDFLKSLGIITLGTASGLSVISPPLKEDRYTELRDRLLEEYIMETERAFLFGSNSIKNKGIYEQH